MSNTTMEEVFKAGFAAGYNALDYVTGENHEDAESAWEKYRYDTLLRVSGKEAADEWLAARHKPQTVIENLKCPDCDGVMVPRLGAYGKFWGCKNYPKCKGTRDSEGLSKAERAANKGQDEDGNEFPADSSERMKHTFNSNKSWNAK